MQPDLHPDILRFFCERMSEHSKVVGFQQIPPPYDLLFRIDRVGDLPPVVVYLIDAYLYGEMDYISRPSCLGRGDFILIATPEGDYDFTVLKRARADGIGIGRIGKLMGALHKREVWLYQDPNEHVASWD